MAIVNTALATIRDFQCYIFGLVILKDEHCLNSSGGRGKKVQMKFETEIKLRDREIRSFTCASQLLTSNHKNSRVVFALYHRGVIEGRLQSF